MSKHARTEKNMGTFEQKCRRKVRKHRERVRERKKKKTEAEKETQALWLQRWEV